LLVAADTSPTTRRRLDHLEEGMTQLVPFRQRPVLDRQITFRDAFRNRRGRAQVHAQGLDRVVDERLFAGELLQRRVEIAFAKDLDASHGLFLHRDMARDHPLMPLAIVPKSP
jgi:hypothetical protein